jgi:hypothetical protein
MHAVTDSDMFRKETVSNRNAKPLPCAKCGSLIETGVAVWMERQTSGYPQRRATCKACVDADSGDAWWRERGYTPPTRFRAPQPCGECGRPIHRPVSRKLPTHNYCSPECASKGWARWHSERRKAARRISTCEACGGTFLPRRADAKFCSVVCKQRAYRGRLAALRIDDA